MSTINGEKKRKRSDRTQRARENGQEGDDVGARHNKVSLFCQTRLGRWMISDGATRFFVPLRDRVYRDRCLTSTRSASAFTAGRSCSPTDDDKFVGNIDSDTMDKIRPACPVGINSFNERMRVAW
ncbi:hypothetical protein ACS0PU_000490 [Formica fusca]